MPQIIYITPTFAVAGALEPADFAALRKEGFKAVISNLPEGEKPDDLPARQAAKLAWQQGLKFRHLPADKFDLFSDDLIGQSEEALRNLEGPILAYCRSGMRSAIVWAAASARNQAVDCVLAALTRAGFDLDFLQEDLQQQADRQRFVATVPALDCAKAQEVPLARPDTAA